MSDNLPTQFPAPPELQPLGQPSLKGRQIFSLVLIVAGFLLLAAGSWMFIQFQIEAHKPPPARIIEVSLADLTPTLTPTPRPSPTKIVVVTPSPLPVQHLGDLLVITPTNTLPATSTPVKDTPTPKPSHTPTSTNTPTPKPSHTPTSANTSTPEPAAILTSTNTATPEPTATLTPTNTSTPEPTVTPLAPTSTPTPEAAVTAVLSMQENPLVAEPADAGVAPEATSESGDAPVVSPITRIVAESIGLDAPVVAVGWTTEMINGVSVNVWTVADYAAGWHKNSALPGQGGNIVLSGHHNINGKVFRYTIDLNVGDIVTLYEGDQAYKYAVEDKFIVKDKGEPDAVRRENAKWIGPFNEERLTLVTCWPYTNNTHRAIVIAKPVQ